jgi:hypothetical protein
VAYHHAMRVGAVLVLVGLMGCADDSVAYRLSGFRRDTGRPLPAIPATLYIDGVARQSLELTFAANDAYRETRFAVELRYGDLVLDTLIAGGQSCGDGTIETVFEDIATFDHGQLTLWSFSISGEDPCIADLFEWPGCITACSVGEHCTSVMTSLDPPFSRLACAPIGPRVSGEACAWQPSADGYVQDCGTDLLCVDGTCRALCTEGACFECPPVEGHSSQLRVCP